MDIEMENDKIILEINEGKTGLKVGDFANNSFVNCLDDNKIEVVNENLPLTTSHVPRRQDALPCSMGDCAKEKSSNVVSVELPASPNHVRRPLTTINHDIDKTVNEMNANISEMELPHSDMVNAIDSDPTVSEGSDTIELDPGDEELLIHRHIKKISTNSVVKDNSEYERDYMYIMCKSLSDQMREIKRQQTYILEKESFNGNANADTILSEKCQIIQDTIQGNNDRVSAALTQVQSTFTNSLERAIGKVQVLVKEDVARSHDDLKVNLDRVQDSLQRELAVSQAALHDDFQTCKNDLVISQQAIENKVEKVASNQEALKGHMQQEMKEIKICMKNDLSNIKKGVNNDMTQLQSVLEGRILGQTLSLATVSTEVLTTVSNIEGQVKTVGLKVDAYQYEAEILQTDVVQLKFDLYEEIENRCKDTAQVNNRIDTIQTEFGDTKIELLAKIASQNIEVMALRSEFKNLVKFMNEIKEVQIRDQANLTHLEGVIEANAVQGNVLNDHLHNIESKLDKVGNAIPELLHSTLTQALNQYQGEAATTNFPNAITPRDCPSPIRMRESPIEQVQQALPQALPSIPSTPLLPDNFITPPLYRQSPPVTQVPVVQGMVANSRTARSDHIIADLVKREQKPSFTGDNVSPPVFLQEVEIFFQLVQITEDRDKLQIFPTFLTGNPSGWWKLISGQVCTWGMAKELLMKQYFNDFDRQRSKAEWTNLNYQNFSSVEEFTLRGLTILNTIKTKDTEQKRCERITIKLPEPLRDYLLNRQFTSTQDFLNQIKEAMLLKNFDSGLYFKSQKYNNGNSDSSASRGNHNNGNFKYGKSYNYGRQNNGNNNNSYSNSNANSNHNYNSNNANNNTTNASYNANYNSNNSNSNNSQNSSGNNSANVPYMGTNPRYRGDPKNYNPNFKHGDGKNATGGTVQGQSNTSGRTPGTPPRGRVQGNPAPNGNGNQTNSPRRRHPFRSSWNRNGNQGTRSPRSNKQANQPLGVNQVGWAAPTLGPTPPVTRPSSPTTPPSPPINHFHFNFGPEIFKGQNKTISTTMPSATFFDHEADGADRVNVNSSPEN